MFAFESFNHHRQGILHLDDTSQETASIALHSPMSHALQILSTLWGVEALEVKLVRQV